MIRTLAVTGALVALAVASSVQAQPMGTAPMAPTSGPMPTPDYVVAAAQSDEFEIAEAKMAIHHASNPHIIAFAHKMVHDHTKSTMMIKAAIRSSGHEVPPPPPLTPAQDQMLADLRGSGANFDSTYVTQQIQAHQMALAVQKSYADVGSDPALRSTAMKIVPVVEMHLHMLDKLQSHMG